MTTATATKTSLKKRTRTASNFIAVITSRSICQMSSFFSLILKDCVKVQEKKKKVVVMCSRPQQNVKLGTFTLKLCNDGKEMYKKA